MREKTMPVRRVLTILAVYLLVMLVTMILWIYGHIAGWVGQTVIAACLARLMFLYGWGMAANGKGWRV